MQEISLSFEINITEREVEYKLPILVNVKKDLDNHKYTSKISDETQIAYLNLPDISFQKNVSFIDEAFQVFENADYRERNGWVKYEGNVIEVDTNDILITNK